MKIELNKRYEMRNGKTINIVLNDNSLVYPFKADSGDWYTKDGHFWEEGYESPKDIVRDISKDLRLEVGKTYKTRNGRMIVIVKKREDDKYPFLSDTGSTYTSKGTFFCYEESSNDIVEEVVFDKKDFIEVGKTYLNRKGEKIKIEREDTNQTVYRFISGDKSYSDIGHFCDKVTEYDLIDEYVEISVEVGHLYECCDGTLIRIIKKLYNETELFLGDNNIAYHKNGESVGSEKNSFKLNIIKEH